MKRADHAVVVGASVAGLLAARALSDHVATVTVLDRDVWSDRSRPRPGVPHGEHAHGLLASGVTALNQLLPGLTTDLVGLGALTGDVHDQVSWHLGGGRLARASSDLAGLLVSRVALERYLRSRVEALPNVTIHEGQGVAGLSLDADGDVGGVEVFGTEGPPGSVTRLPADLVVDASGRRSQADAWLTRRGLTPPVTERVGMDIHYATRWFARRPGDLDGLVAAAHGPTPTAPHGAVVLSQEGDRWVVGLSGYGRDRPPTDLDAFRLRARTTDPLVGELVSSAEPLDDGSRFGIKAALWHRHDRARGLPPSFVVLGDALCSFNPIYGSGMSVAAREAVLLGDCLDEGLTDLTRRFHTAVRPVVETAWRLSTGSDLSLPETTGERPLPARLVGHYLRRYLAAAREDPELAYAFLRVSNLLDTPDTLLAPRRMARVLGRGVRRRPAAVVQTAGRVA